ncbi:TetR/AcrR family transcriptional regulator [Actinocrispum wychmicini]|uniref:TetR family transcriptional regulator n=1 Tax=Actinocrispum wychmicini TaxID=1213861 RepID=A0A4R2JLB0_9PSEU|nr:TetR/AcrR family transcriptional regulator [Actinocrispum wychmicini]TCO57389.1 TetR family transcriptional regulator [Actinocrispum wychmicini]
MSEGRSYSMALRTEQTAVARRRILAAAVELFNANGYLATKLTDVAKAAGVSVQTVYNVVGNKSVLLKAAYDVAIAGDDEPVPIADRPLVHAMIAARSGEECLRYYAQMARELSERVCPLLVMLHGQAATGDPDLRAFVATTDRERRVGVTGLVGNITRRFGLRPGLDETTAQDIVWTLTSPQVVNNAVNGCGWSWDKFQGWLAATLTASLLGS